MTSDVRILNITLDLMAREPSRNARNISRLSIFTLKTKSDRAKSCLNTALPTKCGRISTLNPNRVRCSANSEAKSWVSPQITMTVTSHRRFTFGHRRSPPRYLPSNPTLPTGRRYCRSLRGTAQHRRSVLAEVLVRRRRPLALSRRGRLSDLYRDVRGAPECTKHSVSSANPST